MKRIICIATVLAALSIGPALAQQEAADPVEKHLFAPELLVRYQGRLGLDDEQREGIKEEIRKAETQFSGWEWDLRSEMDALGAILAGERVDEKQALTKLESILELEKKIKRTHLSLVIRIKNRLTAKQQAQLRALEKSRREGERKSDPRG